MKGGKEKRGNERGDGGESGFEKKGLLFGGRKKTG